MSNPQLWNNLPFDTPATYRIRVQGHLDDTWSEQLGGLTLTRAFTADKQAMTILIGHLTDQAALTGVLKALYDMHLALLTVENLDEKLS